MKNLLLIFALLVLPYTFAYADETVETKATQEVDVDASGLVVVFAKQPKTENHTQVIKIRRSGLIFAFLIDGKIQTKVEE